LSTSIEKKKVALLIVCYVPEISDNKSVCSKIKSTFIDVANKHGACIELIDEITTRDEQRVRSSLKRMADYLYVQNRKGIIYYFGHGDQVGDRNGDERRDSNGQDAGFDEIWRTQNILDDEITSIFQVINSRSYLFLFSDSCSSGSMIDDNNSKNWTTLSSSNDKQDSLATSSGGVFTLWGLLPALTTLKVTTMSNIHEYIVTNVQIDSQTSILRFGNDSVRNIDIFE
ncbi:metacaspase-like, partial [Yasminevirus sp. GU-2018]